MTDATEKLLLKRIEELTEQNKSLAASLVPRRVYSSDVYRYIQMNQKVTVAKLSANLRITSNAVCFHLAKLSKKGLIKVTDKTNQHCKIYSTIAT